jgi:hypothetical protein
VPLGGFARQGRHPVAGRDEVGPDMTQRDEAPLVLEPDETAEPAAGDIFEEDALDRLLGTEGQDLREPRPLDQARHSQ